jgi:hypothetical protein
MKRFILWSIATLILGTIALSPALFIYLYNEPPPVTYSRRQVLTPVVPPGGELQIRISSDLTKRCSSEVYRTIVDVTGRPFDFVPEPRPLSTDYTIKLTVPLGAAPGPAYYSARVAWSCNMVQKYFPQEVIQRNIDFIIAPAEGQLPMPQQQGVYQVPFKKSEYARVQGD